MTGKNSAITDRLRCWLLEQGSERRERAPTSGLWSVKTVKGQPFQHVSKMLDCRHHDEKLPIEDAVVGLGFVHAEKNPSGLRP